MPCPWAWRAIDIDLSEEVDIDLLRHLQNCGRCRRHLAWDLTFRKALTPDEPAARDLIEKSIARALDSTEGERRHKKP